MNDDDDRLRTLAGRGMSNKEIARALAVSESTVWRRRQRLGIGDQRGLTLPSHGTMARYGRGCKCEECRKANADKTKRLIGSRPTRHGTRTAYFTRGCRCDQCRDAAVKFNRDTRQGMIDRRSGKHGSSVQVQRGCRCEKCLSWMAESRESRKRANRDSREAATRNGQQWTGAELQHALEKGRDGTWLRTVPQVAKDLGRTRMAVQRIRSNELKYGRLV